MTIIFNFSGLRFKYNWPSFARADNYKIAIANEAYALELKMNIIVISHQNYLTKIQTSDESLSIFFILKFLRFKFI